MSGLGEAHDSPKVRFHCGRRFRGSLSAETSAEHVREPEEEAPERVDHDVEAETFSSQVVGQALAEAARQLAEGGHALFRCGSQQ